MNYRLPAWSILLIVALGQAGLGYGADPAPATLSVPLGGGVSIEFVLIRPGVFRMGSEKGNADEKPVHEVRITKPFYLGKYEVTQAQWQAVMGANPSNFKGDRKPVERVSWEDCQQFVAKLRERVPGREFRLPSEAEWEYACRAGSATGYGFGDDPASLGEYAWFAGNSGRTTDEVGQKKPNAWGLYDVHGNVWEWCQDWSGRYAAGPVVDPGGTATGANRVCRGGSWDIAASRCRAAYRNYYPRGARYLNLGVRLALAVRE